MDNKLNKNKEPHRSKNKIKISSILFATSLIAILISLLSRTAEATLRSSVSSVTGSLSGGLGKFFSNYMTATGPTILDFIIFFAIFFSICWLAFKQWIENAKGAVIMLSISVSVAFSIALVFGAKLTMKKLVPFAGAILFIFMLGAIYFLLTKYIFTGDTIWKKIISAIITLLIGAALLYLLMAVVCDGEKCNNNAFTKKLIGSDSIFGKIKKGVKDLFSGSGSDSDSDSTTRLFTNSEEKAHRMANDFVTVDKNKYKDLERADRAHLHLEKMRAIQKKYGK